MANQYLWCHQLSTVAAVCSAVELGLDGTRTETHQPLMFSRARAILDTQPSDAHFADKGEARRTAELLSLHRPLPLLKVGWYSCVPTSSPGTHFFHASCCYAIADAVHEQLDKLGKVVVEVRCRLVY